MIYRQKIFLDGWNLWFWQDENNVRWAIANNFNFHCPCQYDLTAHQQFTDQQRLGIGNSTAWFVNLKKFILISLVNSDLSFPFKLNLLIYFRGFKSINLLERLWNLIIFYSFFTFSLSASPRIWILKALKMPFAAKEVNACSSWNELGTICAGNRSGFSIEISFRSWKMLRRKDKKHSQKRKENIGWVYYAAKPMASKAFEYSEEAYDWL